MKVFFATWLVDRSHGTSLSKKKASSRLLSFHFLREQKITSSLLSEYSKTGECNPIKNKNK